METLTAYIPTFLFVLLRAGIVISFLPFLGTKMAPMRFKAGLAAAVALVLTPVVSIAPPDGQIAQMVMREVVFGMVLGSMARSVFYAVDMAGQMMSNAMGLSIATVFNPEVGNSAEISRFYGIIAILVFLAQDAHHDLIAVFVSSYEMVPSEAITARDLAAYALSTGGGFFTIAFKIAAPVIVVMLVTQLLLGFLNKAAPQMNVFFVGFPVYIFVGFLVLIAGLPVFIAVVGGHTGSIRDRMMQFMAGAGG